MVTENPRFLELTGESFVRDLRKALSIPPDVLAELANRLNTDKGIKLGDEAQLAAIWAKAGLPGDVLDAAVGIVKFLFSNVADGKSTVDAVLSELGKFCASRNVAGFEERSESIKRVITPSQAYLKRNKVLQFAQGVGRNLESFNGAIELRAVFKDTDSTDLVGYVPVAVLHFEATVETEKQEPEQFVVQVTDNGLNRVIEKLQKLKEQMRRVKEDARAKLGYLHEFEEKDK